MTKCDALISFLTDLGVRGGETATRSFRRATLAISAEVVLILKSCFVGMEIENRREH